MPDALKRSARVCIVCSERTTVAHLGMDVCRACAVFYRRYRARVNRFACRGSGDCGREIVLNCKRCRMDRLSQLLSHPLSVSSINMARPSTSKPNGEMCACPLLARLKTAYRSMCYARLSSELYSRTDTPHPLTIRLDNVPFYSATLDSLTVAHRILLSSSIHFGCEVFPEFAGLPDEVKWSIVVNFNYSFPTFEGCYRSSQCFSDQPEKFLSSYTSWVTDDMREFWTSNAPSGDVAGANEFRRKTFPERRENQAILARFNPCPEEFLALMTLMFFDTRNSSPSVTPIVEKYRAAIVNELRAFYRDERKLDNYAARLGELMTLLTVFDLKDKMRERFEVFRLFDVVPEDNFVYGLRRE